MRALQMAYLALKQSKMLRSAGQRTGYAAQLFNYAEYQVKLHHDVGILLGPLRFLVLLKFICRTAACMGGGVSAPDDDVKNPVTSALSSNTLHFRSASRDRTLASWEATAARPGWLAKRGARTTAVTNRSHATVDQRLCCCRSTMCWATAAVPGWAGGRRAPPTSGTSPGVPSR